ncbi:MFS general substrate transporter, partial [Linderina pennispora]
MFAISAFPALVQLCCLPWLPESPRVLIRRGQEDRAVQILHKVYGQNVPESVIEDELESVHQSMRSENSSRYRDLLRPINFQPLIVACMLQLMQQFSGFNTVMYYSATILKMAGFPSTKSATQFSIAIAATNMIMTIVAIIIIDRFGRRKLLLVSFVGMIVGLILLGIAFIFIVGLVKITKDSCAEYVKCGACTLDDRCGWSSGSNVCAFKTDRAFSDLTGNCESKTTRDRAGTWLALASLIFYVALYAVGLGNVPWLVQSEIFAQGIRSKAGGFATATNWVCNFIISITYLTMTLHITASGTFWLYAGILLIGFAFVFLMVPETKGLKLEDVQRLFTGNHKPYKRAVATPKPAADDSEVAGENAQGERGDVMAAYRGGDHRNADSDSSDDQGTSAGAFGASVSSGYQPKQFKTSVTTKADAWIQQTVL